MHDLKVLTSALTLCNSPAPPHTHTPPRALSRRQHHLLRERSCCLIKFLLWRQRQKYRSQLQLSGPPLPAGFISPAADCSWQTWHGVHLSRPFVAGRLRLQPRWLPRVSTLRSFSYLANFNVLSVDFFFFFFKPVIVFLRIRRPVGIILQMKKLGVLWKKTIGEEAGKRGSLQCGEQRLLLKMVWAQKQWWFYQNMAEFEHQKLHSSLGFTPKGL